VSRTARLPIAILYEHPDWFRPLFTELERRGMAYDRLDAAAHLFDPAISDDDVKRAGQALASIATQKELPQLKQFFAMYRGTAASDEVGVAVGSVAEAMLRLDPKGSRPIIEAAAHDSMTKEGPKARLEQLLAASGGGGGADPAKPTDKK